MPMSTPTVTAEYDPPPIARRACTLEPPRVSLTVEYAHGDHARALDELRTAYEDVKAQILVTGPARPRATWRNSEPDVSGDFTDSPRARLDKETP